MKQQLPPNRHDRHDALLIARFYGGDVDEREATMARELVAECGECASLYADLGAIAVATRRLPAAPRPRDFALTEADGARLARQGRPATARARRLGWVGIRRSLGGILTAAGLLGVVFVSATNVGPTSPALADHGAQDGATPQVAFAAPSPADGQSLVVTAGGGTPELAPTAPASAAASAAALMPTAAPSVATPATAGGPATQGSDRNAPTVEPANPNDGQVADASGGSSGELGAAGDAGSTPPGKGVDLGGRDTSSAHASTAPDDGGLAKLGFALVLLLGLLLLVGPLAIRTARRGAGR